MRLKYGDHFSSDAGAQWRVVFVLTLMPWLMKFSQACERHDDEDDDSEESDADWQLGDSGVGAANGANVALSGNVPWNPSDDSFSSVASGGSEGENARQSRRNDSLKHFESAKSFRGSNGDDVGRSVRNASWKQYASAKSFGSTNGDAVVRSGT